MWSCLCCSPTLVDGGFRRATKTEDADSQSKHLPHHSLGLSWFPWFLQPGASSLELELAWGRGDDPAQQPLRICCFSTRTELAEAVRSCYWFGLQVEACLRILHIHASQLPTSLGFQPSLCPITPQLHLYYLLPRGISRGMDG